MKKKIVSSIVAVLLVFILPISALAASVDGSYDFKGGLFTRSFEMGAGNSVRVTTTPTKWPTGKFHITLTLQQSLGYIGWAKTDASWNYSHVKDTSAKLYVKGRGVYRVYMKSSILPNNQSFKGKVFIN
ncbi:hypothetical protein DUK53_10395 [Listeria sp. SHR_NRA_18]|uniref:hypothetical protein n=1 Tax=Listeria sp. SHR_NRA_18 TaxID=2269046 RepID=UPI00051D6407|nr:hypothetical protein [Listeria sp. SHR_NRA_18]KGL42328.1 hypothetical protein EP56_08925 [Listeriaceae bacterium FSL A5-0209]RQW66529.1 hypothetical protein DUK53_10395 [Listeria sp. SHR_NRA_18]